MRLLQRLSFLGVLFCFLSPVLRNNVFGAIYCVATNGSDANSGSIASPFATLDKAAAKLKPGDTLLIRGGTYNQTMYCSSSGTPALPITIASYPGERAIIDGAYTKPVTTWWALVQVLGSNTSLQHITIRRSNWIGLTLKGPYDQAIDVTSEGNMENGIVASDAAHHSLIQGCSIHDNAQSNAQFQNLRGSHSTGVSAARGANNVTLRGNMVWGNWGEGLSTYEASYTLVESNTVYNNMLNVYLSDTTHTTVQGNLIYSTSNNPCASSSQIGIALGDETYDPPSSDNAIVNNLLLGNSRNIYFWPGSSGGGLVNTMIAFNTCANASFETNLKLLSGSHTNSLVANNIFLQESALQVAIVMPTPGITFSHNLWSKTPPSVATGRGDVIGDPKLLKFGSLAPGVLAANWFLCSSRSLAVFHAISLPDVPVDFYGIDRGQYPDIGGLQHVIFSPAVRKLSINYR